MKVDIYKDFDTFTRLLIGSNDHDPIYPVLKDIQELYSFEPRWFTFVYVAFYNIETAINICKKYPTSESLDRDILNIKWKFGHERRGNVRNPKNMYNLLSSVKEEINSGRLYSFLTKCNNEQFREYIKTLPQHGLWSSYKIAEIFEKSFDCNNLSIPDLGLEGRDPNSNDGPVAGLRWLYGRDEIYSKQYFTTWNKFGANLAKSYGVGIGEIETSLCKFHKTVSGNYFVGHDIVELIELKPLLGDVSYNKIMKNNFASEIWKNKTMFSKKEKQTYLKTNQFINSNFNFQNKLPEVDILKVLLES